MIRPGITIPMHYDTFPVIRQDPEAFRAAAQKRGLPVRVMAPGESFVL